MELPRTNFEAKQAAVGLTFLGSDVGTASSLRALSPVAWRWGSSVAFSDAIFDGCLNVCLRISPSVFLYTISPEDMTKGNVEL